MISLYMELKKLNKVHEKHTPFFFDFFLCLK